MRRFDPGDHRSAMTTSPRDVKLSTAQVRQSLRMKSQAPEVEVVTKVSAKEKKNAEPITEDKKAEQKNEKKSPVRKKVKIRKRKQREKVTDLSDQLRETRKIPEVLKQKPEDQRQHLDLEHFKEKRSGRRLQTQRRGDFQNEDKGLFSDWSSWFAPLPYTRLQTE